MIYSRNIRMIQKVKFNQFILIEEKYTIISIEKEFDKIQHPFKINKLKK